MNILFYTQQDISPVTGGIGRITSIMTEYFRKHFNYKVYSIYADEISETLPHTKTDGKIKLRLHDRLGIRPGVCKNYKKAAQYIAQHQIDIIIIQTSLDVVCRLRKALNQINYNAKIISELHFMPGTDEWRIQTREIKKIREIDVHLLRNLLKIILSPIYNLAIRYATQRAYNKAYINGERMVLLSSSYIKLCQEYAHIQDNSKFEIVPNSLSFNIEYGQEKLRYKEKTIITVARLSEHEKRISYMLRVWQKIEKSNFYKDWNFEIIGDGEDRIFYEKMIDRLNLKQCSLKGRQNPISYYQRASIFLMTSSFEGFPMTLIEAQQFGCVPIVYDAFSALKDVVTNGKNGIITPNNDEEQFEKSLTELMNNTELRYQLAKNAITDCQRFSQETICNQWKYLLENIVYQ